MHQQQDAPQTLLTTFGDATHVYVGDSVLVNPNCHSVAMPYRLESRANERLHWAVKAKRTKADRAVGALCVPAGLRLPLRVKMIRVAPRMLDSDNLSSAFKGVRDGIAQKLGINDNNPSVVWLYEQRKGKPKQYGIQVDIFWPVVAR